MKFKAKILDVATYWPHISMGILSSGLKPICQRRSCENRLYIYNFQIRHSFIFYIVW